ncbi:MAG: hypothetical protein IJI32_06930 [Clostridia bacterium]|nr:hypothetical protein [Clostridia bacterium]
MGRASTKENKSIYQLKREELGLTREKAADIFVGMSPDASTKRLTRNCERCRNEL